MQTCSQQAVELCIGVLECAWFTDKRYERDRRMGQLRIQALCYLCVVPVRIAVLALHKDAYLPAKCPGSGASPVLRVLHRGVDP